MDMTKDIMEVLPWNKLAARILSANFYLHCCLGFSDRQMW